MLHSDLLTLHCDHGKREVKGQIDKSYHKEFFSFVDLNERPNLISSIIWIKSDGHFYTEQLSTSKATKVISRLHARSGVVDLKGGGTIHYLGYRKCLGHKRCDKVL
jgi:hypothetical protein